MCRLLCVSGDSAFEMEEHLAALARIARDSREYQGHGWGCAWLEGGEDDRGEGDAPRTRWRLHHDITPIWEDTARPVGRTTLVVAHARSAFRDEGIRVENNMPFHDGQRVFAFNGELHGVRIKERGRIGAEKVFNFVKRFDRGDFRAALERGLDAIERRARYLRGANLVVADISGRVHYASRFREDPAYYKMHFTEVGGARILCSEPYPGTSGAFGATGGLAGARHLDWVPIENGSTGVL